ncbi:hypothetical protein WN51_14680 [Melipona quadrifasciata]|uniref:Uncharacterized protein n=1 Tax=Melipona quadrifasciata TaxID=166423 RepID=A0A0N0BFD4_9HYME|nr:hypothetical protein WN51_14680 [Melipona quadrifasciata]
MTFLSYKNLATVFGGRNSRKDLTRYNTSQKKEERKKERKKERRGNTEDRKPSQSRQEDKKKDKARIEGEVTLQKTVFHFFHFLYEFPNYSYTICKVLIMRCDCMFQYADICHWFNKYAKLRNLNVTSNSRNISNFFGELERKLENHLATVKTIDMHLKHLDEYFRQKARTSERLVLAISDAVGYSTNSPARL